MKALNSMGAVEGGIASKEVAEHILEILELQRILSSFAIFFFLTKLTYYMKLMDEIAPFVEIIIRIVVDIYYFLIVVGVSLIFFGCSFYLIA